MLRKTYATFSAAIQEINSWLLNLWGRQQDKEWFSTIFKPDRTEWVTFSLEKVSAMGTLVSLWGTVSQGSFTNRMVVVLLYLGSYKYPLSHPSFTGDLVFFFLNCFLHTWRSLIYSCLVNPCLPVQCWSRAVQERRECLSYGSHWKIHLKDVSGWQLFGFQTQTLFSRLYYRPLSLM